MGPRRCNAGEIRGQGARVFLAILLTLMLQGGVRGEGAAATGPEDLASRLVDEFEKLERLRAENGILQRELAALAKSGGGAGETSLVQNTRTLPVKTREMLARVLEQNVRAFQGNLEQAREHESQSVRQLMERLTAVRRELIDGETKLLTIAAQEQFAGRIATLVNVDNKWLWFGGVVAFLTVICLFLYERRHDLRRLTWVRVSRFRLVVGVIAILLAVPLLPTLATFLFGNTTNDALLALAAGEDADKIRYSEKNLEELKREQQAELGNHQAALEKLKHLREQQRQGLADAFAPVAQAGGADDGAAEFVETWEGASRQTRALAVDHALREVLARALDADLKSLAELRTGLETERHAVTALSRTKQISGVAIGSGLICATLVGGVFFQRNVRRRMRQIARTCPRCLSQGTLVKETTTPMGEPLADTDLAEMRCTKVLTEAPYTECGFSFDPKYLEYEKMTFPTLGVPSSGKTYWLAMAYSQLNHGRHPDNVNFERVKSRGSDQFDRIVDNVLTSRINTSATMVELPYPVIFDFQDGDWPIRSSLLINVFDFAGAVTIVYDVHNYLRKRQLNSDGYLFFLDPTLPTNIQAEALLKFRDEVKQSRRLRAGQQLHTPVALCLTKIDLLPTIPELAGGDVVQQFFSDLNRADESGNSMSLKVLLEKSRLVSQLRDQIWPNWEIERQVRGLFGDRVLFFPMTPVGLNNPGESDPSQRTNNPYGILQPLMWLMHMNGYPVLNP